MPPKSSMPSAGRQSPYTVNKSYAISAKNLVEKTHCKKRIGISFIYLMILQDLVERFPVQVRGAECALTTMATLQTKSGSGPTQAAHQVIGELQLGGVYLYNLLFLNPRERKALVYCTAAVSVIDRAYNIADFNLEQFARPAFLQLAVRVQMGEPIMAGNLWGNIIQIVIDSCAPAIERVKTLFNNDLAENRRYNTTQFEIAKILEGYKSAALEALDQRNRVEQFSTNDWIGLILRGGFKY